MAHSWGGVLSYVALRNLEKKNLINPGDVDLLITITTPLGWADRPTPSSQAVGPELGRQGVLISEVKTYVKEKLQKPTSVTTWKNYFSTDPLDYGISMSIQAATANYNTKKGHTASYTDPTLLKTYGAEIAAALAKAEQLRAQSPSVQPREASRASPPSQPAQKAPVAASTSSLEEYLFLSKKGAKWVYDVTLDEKKERRRYKGMLTIINEGETVFEGTKAVRFSWTYTYAGGAIRQENIYKYLVSSPEGVLEVGTEVIRGSTTLRSRYQPPMLWLKEPLQAGTAWEYQGTTIQTGGKTQDYSIRRTVQMQQQVTVPVGQFESMGVVWQISAVSGTTWWAKGIGIVKDEYSTRYVGRVAELVEYSIPGEAPVVAKVGQTTRPAEVPQESPQIESASPSAAGPKVTRAETAPDRPTPCPTSGPKPGKAVITGKILDGFRRPLFEACVRIQKTTFSALTDRNGEYRIGYVPGQVELLISKSGYTEAALGLNISTESHFPAQTIILIKIPPEPGIYLFGSSDYVQLKKGRIQAKTKDFPYSSNKPIYVATYFVDGDFTSATASLEGNVYLFLDNTGVNQSLFRVKDQNIILRRESYGNPVIGLGGNKDSYEIVKETIKQAGRDIFVRGVTLGPGKYSFAGVVSDQILATMTTILNTKAPTYLFEVRD